MVSNDRPDGPHARRTKLTMINDHGTVLSMKEIAISKFKATCLAVVEQVRRTRRPIRITRFGKPVAEVVPPSVQPASKRALGAMEGRGEITGDIVHATPWSDAIDAPARRR